MTRSHRERSLSVFPAGSNGEFNLPPELACVIERGEGCRLWRTDGREMLDFSMGWGSALVGHARAEIVAAVQRQVAGGSNFAYVTSPSLDLAEQLVDLSPACEAVRFCASGTEATMYCLRLARAATGKDRVLKFEGAYHGAHDVGVSSLFPADPPDHPLNAPSSAGVATGVASGVLVAPFNDLERTRQIVAEHSEQLAAIVVEPLQRCLPPEPGFLQGLRRLTDDASMLLVFDEVVTGFRLSLGGAQQYYGVQPDLVAYGKALGGGMPIGAFGGRRELMEMACEDRLGEAKYVWTASTLGGNPVSCAAACAALDVYRGSGVYEHFHGLGRRLREEMRRSVASCGIDAQIIGDGPLAQVVFTGQPVRDYRSTQRGDRQLGRRVMLELFRRDVFLNPMGTKLYLSLAHTDAEVDQFIDRFEESLHFAIQRRQMQETS